MGKGPGDKAVRRDTAAKMSLIFNIRELKQLGRRRQRRLQKTIGLKGQCPDNAHARASSVFFFKRQKNCQIDSTRFPSGPHRRRRFVVYILRQYFRLSKKSFVLFKIWLAARRIIAILSLAGRLATRNLFPLTLKPDFLM